jgi:hypothetical protein
VRFWEFAMDRVAEAFLRHMREHGC